MDKGSIVRGEITAIKPYGAFVKIDKQFVGLIHISEISDGFVRNIEDYVTVGDVIDLKVLDVKGNKFSLSFKALHKRKKRYKITLKTGFSPLEAKLDQWIDAYHLENDE
jgi:predicted RNA-binding protein with RPS1 domain